MIQRLGEAYKTHNKIWTFYYKKNWGCQNRMAIWDYNLCIPERKSKGMDALNSPPDIAEMQK